MIKKIISTKNYIKISLVLLFILIACNNVFGYNILIDAVCEDSSDNTCSTVTYLETTGAYKKSASYYSGTSISYPYPTNTFISSNPNDVSWTGIPNFNFEGSQRTANPVRSGDYILRSQNPVYYDSLSDFYSVGARTTLFHTSVGTNYNGSERKVAYQSYSINGTTGQIDNSTLKNSTAVISGGNPNFICHELGTEYQYKVVNGIYYSYNRIHITDTMRNNFQDIATPSDGGVAVGNRLYLSKSMSTKDDAYDLQNGHRSYTVNRNTIYSLLSMAKLWRSTDNSGWGTTSVSGYKTDDDGNQTNTINYEGSMVNLYDNVIQLGKGDKIRKIYVNHVDASGNVIGGFQNTSSSMVVPFGETRNNDQGEANRNGYQEYYEIKGAEQIAISKSSKTESNGKLYVFDYGKSASGSSISVAKTNLGRSAITWSTNSKTFGTDNVSDYVVVNLVYKEVSIVEPKELTLIGRLGFINERNSSYSNSTTNLDVDYVPSTTNSTTGELTSYTDNAYPYFVKALRYEKRGDIGNKSVTIKVVQPYNDGGTYKEISKNFTYTIPYQRTWYKIVNFKMYRISRLEVYDSIDNLGGKLFSGTKNTDTITVYTSNLYNSKFNNRGKIDSTIKVDLLYNTTQYSLSQTNGYNNAINALNGLTEARVARDVNLRIDYAYDNDYIEFDGNINMLQRNYNWGTVYITSQKNDILNLDSTNTNYTSNLGSYIRPATKTSKSYFDDNYQTIPWSRENGNRTLKGKIYYDIVTDSKFNIGSNAFYATDAIDQVRSPGTAENTKIEGNDLLTKTKDYIDNDVNKVNVLTPISFGDFNIVTAKYVDHTVEGGTTAILQKNAEFTITPKTAGSNTAAYNFGDTREFVKGYYFIFDFNIIYNSKEVLANTPIYIAGNNASITAKVTDSYGSGSAAQLSNTIKIVAVTTNITDALMNYFKNTNPNLYKYVDSGLNTTKVTGLQNETGLLNRTDILNDTYHAISKVLATKNVGRIFDFAVTDCTDMAFKDIFRKTGTANINEPTGISYYSGYKYWNLYSSEYNEMLDRTDVGNNPQKILPLGPYKNTTTSYINAPKMGYRISFDLKTTGYMDSNNETNSRKVEITPRYYYISKDGETFDKNIKLYYKNSSDKYINFSSSGYTIYYKPNDGYRYLRNSMYTDNYTLMSTKLEPLTVASKIVLTNKMMSANNTSFVQAWYGEFKLPNSTIAVSNTAGNANNNINNPYKDGYIGVIFDIKCIDTSGFTLSYDTIDKSANSSTNTTQWDYEGFMNFKTPGSATNILKYQLEKDIWNIDNTRYQDIKGTVVLFDLDNRAANDFE